MDMRTSGVSYFAMGHLDDPTVHTHYFLACGSRLSPRLKVKQKVFPETNCLSFSRIVSHSHSSLLDLPPFPFPFFFYYLAVTTYHLIHGQQGLFGCLARQKSALTQPFFLLCGRCSSSCCW